MEFFKRVTLEKMCKNCKSALKERAPFFYPLFKGVYASLNQVCLLKIPHPLRCSFIVKSLKGRRAKMEDEYFLVENEKGLLAGVLDGHNGIQVAHYVKNRFLESFNSLLENLDENVYETFLHFFYLLQEEIKQCHPEWDQIGSTVVVSYLEKDSSYIYTATLGDSEANIYRILKKKWRSIPLSPLRNWSTKRDFISAKEAVGVALPRKKNPKEMRHPPPGISPHLGFGINVSRALGDEAFKGVIHCPKVTVTTLFPGDIVLLACDGLKDFVSEKEIIEIIGSERNQEDFSQQLIDYAIFKKSSSDNVTFVSIFIN